MRIMSQDFVNIEDLIIKWASDFPLDKSQRKDADDIQSADINWKHLRARHGTTEYHDQSRAPTPKSHVLFSAYFTNNTDQAQVYTLKTERRTCSTCALSLDKGYTYGASVDIKLVPPNPVIEANAGFHGELSMNKSTEETFEEELIWSVDNQISVPPMFKTKAELVIKEDEYGGNFKTETKFDGRISVTLRNKKDNTPITTITGDVRQVFTADKGFRVDKTGIHLVTQGRCKCRFGIEQHVRLSQSALTEEDKE